MKNTGRNDDVVCINSFGNNEDMVNVYKYKNVLWVKMYIQLK